MSEFRVDTDYGNLKRSNSYDMLAKYRQEVLNKLNEKKQGLHTSRIAQDLRDAIAGSQHTAAGRTGNN